MQDPKIELYQTSDGQISLSVHLENDTVWLTQEHMATLFERDRSVISKHLKNIFESDELDEKSNVQNMQIAFSDKPVKIFSLDTIISVGYRVKSKRGIQFRQWATKTLKEHLVKGYTLAESRLAEKGLTELEQSIELLSRTLQSHALVTEIGQEVLEIIQKYAKTWQLLLQYDDGNLTLPATVNTNDSTLTYKTATVAISDLKQRLISQHQATELFGIERHDQLDSILGNIDQTFDGTPVYPTWQVKSAHLLYFVIKDHPFTDGNKRIGSFLFLLYLNQQQFSMDKLNNNAMVALALLIAESDPKQKELMIRLICNLLS